MAMKQINPKLNVSKTETLIIVHSFCGQELESYRVGFHHFI